MINKTWETSSSYFTLTGSSVGDLIYDGKAGCRGFISLFFTVVGTIFFESNEVTSKFQTCCLMIIFVLVLD